MHGNEWSLIVFTLFAQVSVGLFIIREVFHRLTSLKYGIKAADHMSNGSLFLIGPLLLVALSVSFFHLGSPVNAVNALNNLASSWLSREIFFELLFIGTFTLYAFLQLRNISTIPIRRKTALVTAIIGLLLVFSMAKLYMLPTVPVWNNIWTPISFFITTFLLGSLALAVVFAVKSRRHPLLARYAFNRIALVSIILIGIEILIMVLFSLFPGSQNIFMVSLRFIFLLIGAGLTILIFYRTRMKDQDVAIKNRFVYAAFLSAFFAEGLGRYLFYAAYTNLGL
jgi:anaerobic dimethyl sulfoxide reductase subunit C (anchor subunit)